MSKPALDQVDRDIIKHLLKDARISNGAIAELLGVTEGTIRARLKRLLQARLIRFTALTNLTRLGTMRVVFIRVKVTLAHLREVAVKIGQIDDIKFLAITTGPYNILATGNFGDLDSGVEAVIAQIGAIHHVQGLEVSIVVQPIKYNPAAVMLPPRERHSSTEEDS